MTQDPSVQAMQHVKSLVATEPGERVQRPSYGVPTRQDVFAPGLNLVSNQLYRDVVTQMATYEPSIQVENVVPVDTGDDYSGQAPVQVTFSQEYNPSTSDLIATVQVGGTVYDD